MPSWLDEGLSAMRSNSEEEVAEIEINEEGCTWTLRNSIGIGREGKKEE